MKRRTVLLGAAAAAVGGVPVLRAEEGGSASADVIVAGGGAAGLCAAVRAAQAGARVLLFEKNEKLGGDTLISGGYFNAVDPVRQAPMGIFDSEEGFETQILKSGAGFNSPEAAAVLARESSATLRWLESLGMAFLPGVYEIFGSGFPRAHKPVLPRGRGYIQTLSEAALSRGVIIRTSSPVEAFLQADDGRVTGVRTGGPSGPRMWTAGRGVVAASGGFGASRSMRRRYAPDTADLPTDSQSGATGELIEAAARAGADIVNMRFVECVPGGAAEFDYPIRLDYVPSRMIIVNSAGRRFVDETGGRRAIAAAVLEEMKRGPCFAVASDRALDLFDPISRKNLYRGLYAGQAWRAKTPEALARAAGLPEEALLAEVSAAAAQRSLDRPPFWAARIWLRVHHTLGGIAVSGRAEVLNGGGRPVPGFYAAGAVTGNVHGAERIGGNGLASACTFGRIAGEMLAKTL